ncbi:MAG: glutaminyl-peptide cyclotransferase [Cyclobacteriaceae bacterium]|nr:glutaminyl-peptide cyclotransferase [Cyclobacteriaceae bacterium HetDA_MAG_MS6]
MMKFFATTITATLIFILISCDGSTKEERPTKSPRIKKVVRLKSPKSNQKFQLGNDVTFNLAIKDNIVLDSVTLTYGHEKTSYRTSTFSWKYRSPQTGSPRIKLTAYFEGRKEVLYPKVRFLSAHEPEEFTYKVVRSFPHDKKAYTQGLYVKDNILVESTGQHKESTLRKVDLQSGKVLKLVKLPDSFFGEGCTEWNNQIFQLTWKSNTAIVYDQDFNELNRFSYPTEGWGLTTMGDTLVMSDGTEKLHLVNPRDFSEIKVLEVYDNKKAIKDLNELEFFNGLIYANVYTKDFIVAIDPQTGAVMQKIDLSGLLSSDEQINNTDVLNGIAYDSENDKILVTGKWWPKVFEVTFVSKSDPI